MTELLSKLQFKNYLKGEYINEKRRGLNETLQLIKDFPWDAQRGDDIQHNGPSVTILDDNANYLKIGIYYNNSFCVYYYSKEGALYEMHLSDLAEVGRLVTSFFDFNVDLQNFKKVSGSASLAEGYKSGQDVIYRMDSALLFKKLMAYLLVSLIMIGLIVILIAAGHMAILLKALLVALMLFALAIFVMRGYIAVKYYKLHKDFYLLFLSGSDIFRLGCPDGLKEYKRSDVAEINVYGVWGRGRPSELNIAEVVLTDGDRINLPGMLVGLQRLTAHMNSCPVNKFNSAKDFAPVISGYGDIAAGLVKFLFWIQG